MKKVTVMMSTYNGEKYLEKQVDSILCQENVDVKLIVRDDGSSDGTLSIIKKYAQENTNIEVIFGNNMGYSNSFLTLVGMQEHSDYYAFADQDDVWLPKKLSEAIKKLEGKAYSIYASGLIVVDQDENYLSKKNFNNFKGTLGSVLSRNRLAGCTMVFGNDIKQLIMDNCIDIIRFNNINYGHDGWCLLFAILYGGEVLIDDRSYILYRRHESTTTNIHGGIFKRIKNEFKIFINKDNKRIKIAQFLLQKCNSKCDEKTIQVLKKISKYKTSLSARVRLFFGKDLKTNIMVVDLKNKIAVLVGRY